MKLFYFTFALASAFPTDDDFEKLLLKYAGEGEQGSHYCDYAGISRYCDRLLDNMIAACGNDNYCIDGAYDAYDYCMCCCYNCC